MMKNGINLSLGGTVVNRMLHPKGAYATQLQLIIAMEKEDFWIFQEEPETAYRQNFQKCFKQRGSNNTWFGGPFSL